MYKLIFNFSLGNRILVIKVLRFFLEINQFFVFNDESFYRKKDLIFGYETSKSSLVESKWVDKIFNKIDIEVHREFLTLDHVLFRVYNIWKLVFMKWKNMERKAR